MFFFGLLNFWTLSMACYSEQHKILKAVFVFNLTQKGGNAPIRLRPGEGANLNYWTNCQSVNLYGHIGSLFEIDTTRKFAAEIVETPFTDTLNTHAGGSREKKDLKSRSRCRGLDSAGSQ
jgi:hypothetical protein